MDSPEYSAIKAQIEAELKKLAGAGKVTYYKDLGETIGKPARWAMWVKSEDCWIFSPGPHPLRVVF